jgi:hypothetical protein
MIRLTLAAVVLMLLPTGTALSAQEPEVVAKEVREAEEQCRADGGRPLKRANFLRVDDLNGDGGEDWVLDFSKFECAGSVPSQPFCGSGGCSLSIYLWSGGAAWTKAFDETVQTFRFVKQNGRPVLRVEFGGAACGKVNAKSCPKTYVFQGQKLVPVRGG